MANVTIIGAGHWGIALASVVAANGYNVLVYARKEEAAKAINNGYSNYFKNIKLNKNIKATSIIDEAVSFSNIIVVAIPVATIYSFMNSIIQIIDKRFIFLHQRDYIMVEAYHLYFMKKMKI